MGVMAAGVGNALVLGNADLFLRQVPRILLDGKRVHIRPKKDRLSRLSSVDLADDASVFHFHVFDPKSVQLFMDHL